MTMERPDDESRAYRVHGGEKIGSHDRVPEVGEVIENRYGTNSELAVSNIIAYNDEWAGLIRGDSHDRYQRIVIIKVDKWHIPEPDVTYNEQTDQGQIFIEKGVVEEALSVKEFIQRYLNTLSKESKED